MHMNLETLEEEYLHAFPICDYVLTTGKLQLDLRQLNLACSSSDQVTESSELSLCKAR